MGVEVAKPKAQQTSMGRRLFGMAAPIVGGVVGGPMGAAVGGVVGAKATGADTQGALMAGAETGISQYGSEKATPKTPKAGPAASVGTAQMGHSDLRGQTLMQPQANNAFSRKLTASQTSPQVAAAEGLQILSQYPPGHPLRQQYTAPLVQMQMQTQRRYG